MYKYLDKVREKPVHHRKRFALLASGTITMSILAVWSFVMFGGGGEQVLAEENRVEHSPFESLKANVGSALDTFKGDFDKLLETVESVDLEAEYEEMRQDAKDTYER